jgi:hypothetical protein
MKPLRLAAARSERLAAARSGQAVALAAALALAVVAMVRGTFAIGGSDSSCYALMADAFAHGRVQPVFPLAEQVPWPDASRTFAPGGFIPAPARAAAASPICAPGFALLLAPFRWIARDAIFWVTPVAAAMLVWCVFLIGRYLAGPIAGAFASVLIATSPIVLFQAMQPMNDIATTALWMAVFASATLEDRRRSWLMGAFTGVAILVRPNLAPLALVVATLAPDLRFAAAAAPGVLIAMTLNWVLYGHPAQLGYGNTEDLFALRNIGTNLAHHGRAWLETQTPFALLALAAPFVLTRDRRRFVWAALAMAFGTIAIYLLYQPFPEWWYLRFLLPAIAIATTVAAAVTVVLLQRRLVIAAAAVVLAVFGARTAVARQAFELQRLESRFRHTGDYVREKLPANAIFFSVFDSGSVRYHGDREAVLWDALDPAWLDRAIEWSRAHEREPFFVLERFEEPIFRQRFRSASPAGGLDWPPRAEINRQVRIYAPSDRAAYLAGKPVATEYVWP